MSTCLLLGHALHYKISRPHQSSTPWTWATKEGLGSLRIVDDCQCYFWKRLILQFKKPYNVQVPNEFSEVHDSSASSSLMIISFLTLLAQERLRPQHGQLPSSTASLYFKKCLRVLSSNPTRSQWITCPPISQCSIPPHHWRPNQKQIHVLETQDSSSCSCWCLPLCFPSVKPPDVFRRQLLVLISIIEISQTVKRTLSDVHLDKKVAAIILLLDRRSLLFYIFPCILNYIDKQDAHSCTYNYKHILLNIYSYIQSKTSTYK